MSSIRLVLGLVAILSATGAPAAEQLVRFYSDVSPQAREAFLQRNGGKLTLVSKAGNLYKWTASHNRPMTWDAGIQYVQKNRTYSIFQNPSIVANRDRLLAELRRQPEANEPPFKDNPEILEPGIQSQGADPLLTSTWGIGKVGADAAWKKTAQGKDLVVAVTDTGVDYTHPDLLNNLWRNKGEVAGNSKDDDDNGYVDDLVGYDFAADDNKPYDLTLSLLEILLQGGNPGHGTHVAGVVGARLNNAQGVAGVAPQVKIMALRFITEKGQGSTEAAIKAIDYAVDNGAHIINASWGGEKGDEDDSALIEAIERAEKEGVIFVAAAGNGRLDPQKMTAVGFDNDTDAKPMVPASYDIGNIVAVSALSDKDELAPFSNWGHKSVKLGAPGVKIMSTVPGNRYQDTVIDLGQIKATWDGTSMAAPFVAGALAVVWSQGTTQSPKAVVDSLLSKTTDLSALKGKVSTEGRLEMRALRP